jgi:hypothetical protein
MRLLSAYKTQKKKWRQRPAQQKSGRAFVLLKQISQRAPCRGPTAPGKEQDK